MLRGCGERDIFFAHNQVKSQADTATMEIHTKTKIQTSCI